AVYGLTFKDFDRIRQVEGVTRAVPLRLIPQEVRRREHSHVGRVVGAPPAVAEALHLRLADGRFFTDEDEADARNVAVLRAAVVEDLFPDGGAVGQTVLLGQHLYTVTGVLGVTPGGGAGDGPADSDVYVPLRTCTARFGEKVFLREKGVRRGGQAQLHRIMVTVDAPARVPQVAAAVRGLLAASPPTKDWDVQTPTAPCPLFPPGATADVRHRRLPRPAGARADHRGAVPPPDLRPRPD